MFLKKKFSGAGTPGEASPFTLSGCALRTAALPRVAHEAGARDRLLAARVGGGASVAGHRFDAFLADNCVFQGW
jgi:hypothetical protein